MDEQNGVKEEGDLRLDIPPTLDTSLLTVLFPAGLVTCSPERWIQRLQSPCSLAIGKYFLRFPILPIRTGYTGQCTSFSRYGVQICFVESMILPSSLPKHSRQARLSETPFQWPYLLP